MKINFNLKKHNFSKRWEKEDESNGMDNAVHFEKKGA